MIADIKKPVYSLLLDPSELKLLCGTSIGNLHIIDIIQRAEVKNIEAHKLGIFDMKFAGEILITAGGDGALKIWDKRSFNLIISIQASEKSARVIAVAPDNKYFAVGFSDHQIRIYDTVNFDNVNTLSGHKNSVFALSFSNDGNYLLSSGRDAMLKIWDVKDNFKLMEDIPSHTAQVKCISFHPEGKIFATSSMDKTIKIWDANNFELLKVLDKPRNDSHTNCINKLIWIDALNLISCSDDRSVIAWEITTE